MNHDFDLHYYRLKMIDLDQTFEYSEIRSIHSERVAGIKIFPNPFTETIQIEIPSEYFEISNITGEVIYRSESPSKNVDLSFLPTGVYFVKYFQNNEIISKKIIKSK